MKSTYQVLFSLPDKFKDLPPATSAAFDVSVRRELLLTLTLSILLTRSEDSELDWMDALAPALPYTLIWRQIQWQIQWLFLFFEKGMSCHFLSNDFYLLLPPANIWSFSEDVYGFSILNISIKCCCNNIFPMLNINVVTEMFRSAMVGDDDHKKILWHFRRQNFPCWICS